MTPSLREALAFAASVIKSGEPWTSECERIIGAALAAPDEGRLRETLAREAEAAENNACAWAGKTSKSASEVYAETGRLLRYLLAAPASPEPREPDLCADGCGRVLVDSDRPGRLAHPCRVKATKAWIDSLAAHRHPPASPPSPAPRRENDCDTCRHSEKPSHEEPCDSCLATSFKMRGPFSRWEPRAPSPAPEAAPCHIKSGKGACPSCGATVEPTPCHCGAMHVGVYCWPCHHQNVGHDRCAAPHCPEHGFPATERWLKERAPAPSPAADARKGE